MGARLSGDDDVMADINITPFVDIVLVVLIIFMVASPVIARQAIKVNLPDAATGEGTEHTSIGLTLKADGQLLLDGQATSVDAVRTALREAHDKDGSEAIAIIGADRDVAHGRVVWLMDLVRTEGIVKFAINIDKTDMIGPDPGAP
jgi:biopolymer transport protein ExbD